MAGSPSDSKHTDRSRSNDTGDLAVCSRPTMLPAPTGGQAGFSLVHFVDFVVEAMAAVSLIGFSSCSSTSQHRDTSNEQSLFFCGLAELAANIVHSMAELLPKQ